MFGNGIHQNETPKRSEFNKDRRDWKRFYFPCFLFELFEFSYTCTAFVFRGKYTGLLQIYSKYLKNKEKKPKVEKEKKRLNKESS